MENVKEGTHPSELQGQWPGNAGPSLDGKGGPGNAGSLPGLGW